MAYELPTYEQAKGALLKIRSELKVLNLSAVASLDDGVEETLTLHRLGLFRELGESLKTTNSLESINAQLGQRTDKVDYWRNSDQKHRWENRSSSLWLTTGFNTRGRYSLIVDHYPNFLAQNFQPISSVLDMLWYLSITMLWF